jgi:hypothetical protein
MRYDGITPYINHVYRVVDMVGKNKYLKCLAFLHDTIEDSKMTGETLLDLGVDSGIVARTLVLTHNPNDTYNDYIRIIRDTPLSCCIQMKIADIVSNLSDEPSSKQIEKYYKALLILNEIND